MPGTIESYIRDNFIRKVPLFAFIDYSNIVNKTSIPQKKIEYTALRDKTWEDMDECSKLTAKSLGYAPPEINVEEMPKEEANEVEDILIDKNGIEIEKRTELTGKISDGDTNDSDNDY